MAVPEAFASLSTSADEYEHLSTYMKAEPCAHWLAHRFLGYACAYALVLHCAAGMGPEIRHLQTQFGKTSVDWDDFEMFMRRSFANTLPAHEARCRYDKLSQTGLVKDYVHELVQVVRELQGTPYHPGGSVFDDFIKRLKSDVHSFVQVHASTGGWTDINDLYRKALDYEVNGLASRRGRECGPEGTNQPNASISSDSSGRCHAGKKGYWGRPPLPPKKGQSCRG